MKKIILFLIPLTLIYSCSGGIENEEDENSTTSSTDTLFGDEGLDAPVQDPNQHLEYHPNGAVKIEGRFNDDGDRHGLWNSYYDNGIKWSESYYSAGNRDGHSITFFPNGAIRYVGEYKNDEKVGNWKFYDEEGNLVKEENF